MIKSMTGYGKAVLQGEDASYCIEIKTVNHRYADIGIKMPRALLFAERALKKQVAARLVRGKIDVFVSRDSGENAAQLPQINESLAAEYVKIFRALSSAHGLDGGVPLELVAAQKDVITVREADMDEEQVSANLTRALDLAIDAVDAMRRAEGEALQRDIAARLEQVKRLLKVVEERAPQVAPEWQEKLRQRLDRLYEDGDVDPQRLAQEVAIFADRCDISEEIVRFNSHLDQLQALFTSNDAVGRQMDFLLQELNRETNTMGSKSNDAELTTTVVAIKAELEKIREQVQNIE